MDLDTIKKLMEAMEESGTTRVSLKEENGFALELERSPDFHMKPYVQHAEPHVQHMQPAHQPHHKVAEELKQVAQSRDDAGVKIMSPMVGTFYSSPSPDDPPFVSVGDEVKEDTVVCIIEAMKVMNEVKAGKSGKIKKVFVDNAHPVEFGTQLFLIEA
ncbi:acetyl-CoA carboxylase biotin carboxyl carrier protein [Simkania negevensis]|uniref:Biotin carboxyl carrier protein of acetyl-CoA carboxylase n=1 Tax=Simkania negevensis (strain ATCC VR-1471 / DSM 27360 / Z) TaxID=331113 RepID=F8L5K1_SIMNZ|nr:acetyl-CoA carboxylase biotin carboxyl carrier protein [Simkania negevensis]CCB89621.1 biotin carboxyl carrier protein of acetyl-CoA carboxylase [Simkania negevensis Z]